jgi:hypothetical protein
MFWLVLNTVGDKTDNKIKADMKKPLLGKRKRRRRWRRS